MSSDETSSSPSMFMFRSRRSNTVRRLWKLWKIQQADIQHHQDYNQLDDDKKTITAMLSRLKDSQLESLVLAVETQGEDIGQCCPVPMQGRSEPPHVRMVQVFRNWEAVTSSEHLVRLPWCYCDISDNIYICCNPYHWSRTIHPDTLPESSQVSGLPESSLPGNSSSTISTSVYSLSSSHLSTSSSPPSYTSYDPRASGRGGFNFQDVSQSCSTMTRCSVATEGGSSEDGGLTWCRLAYWEERSRVGHQVPVTSNAVEVFNQVPRPNPGHDSMCLESLHSLNPKPSQSTVRTREKIGLGLIINRDETGIWAHNRSNVPIFVNSPTLDVPNSRTFNVFKIPPGFSMQIFNFDLARTYQSLRDPSCYDGPFDPYSVRLSFAKGWGQNYARQYIECCPCWLEILLIPPR